MSHLCDSTVAGLTARRDNVLASKCEYPPFSYPPFTCALSEDIAPLVGGQYLESMHVKDRMQLFLLAVESFLLAMELFYGRLIFYHYWC